MQDFLGAPMDSSEQGHGQKAKISRKAAGDYTALSFGSHKVWGEVLSLAGFHEDFPLFHPGQ